MNARERLLASWAPELVEALEELIDEHVSALHNVEAPGWLSIEQAANYCSVSKRTISRWLKDKRLRPSSAFSRPLIAKADIDALLSGDGGGTVRTDPPRRRRAQSSPQRPES